MKEGKGFDEARGSITKEVFSLPKSEKTKTEEAVYLYKGIEGFKNYLRDILSVREDVFFIGAKGGWFDKGLQTFIKKFLREAKEKGKSNCPHCAIGNIANKSKIWKLNEMDADHVSAWSKGGATDIKNCQMLCITHNRAKGNR